MKTHLTSRILRQIGYTALYQDTQLTRTSLSPQCWRRRGIPFLPSTGATSHQQRNLFNFFRRRKGQLQKTAVYQAGYDVLLELNEKLKMGVRPPPVQDVQKAFRKFTHTKKYHVRAEDVQVEHMKIAFAYIREEASKGEWQHDLSAEDVGDALAILTKKSPEGVKSRTYLAFAKVLFEDSKSRYQDASEEVSYGTSRKSRFRDDILSYIQILAANGEATEARRVTGLYSTDGLIEAGSVIWPIAQGLIQEHHDQELARWIRGMEARNMPMDLKLQTKIIVEYARERQDVDKTIQWYKHPVQGGQQHSSRTHRVVLELFIHKGENECGSEIVRHFMQAEPGDKEELDMTLLWAAGKGRGVDEIERMMEVLARENENHPHLLPDMKTINRLAKLAIDKFDDPYTAERYIALGQKMGFKANAQTHLIQLNYRINKKDLSGAMVSYSSLRNQKLRENDSKDHLLALNHLIVAFCEQRSENYDAIMSLVDDLGETKAPVLPETVAALAKLHLLRFETDDLEDLLNTYAPSFGSADRELVCGVLIDHILDTSVGKGQAWKTWNLAKSVFPETPVAIRVEVMKSFFDRQRPDMATHVFGQMRHSHLKEQRPTIETYATCLEGIARFADAESLETVHNMFKLDNEVEPSTKIYNALMIGYTGCDQSSRALDFWEEIIHSREGPTYSSIQIALRACERAQFGAREARKIWKRLEGSEIEITREIYAAYLGALAGQGLFDECASMCKDVEKLGFSVDALLLGTFFNATRGEVKRQRIKEWAREFYPEAYESLLKCGQYEIKRPQPGLDPPNEGYQGLIEREIYFNIGDLGRDAKS